MTALWDALFGCLALAFSPAGERSLVLLFTDGLENASWLREDDLAQSVKRSASVVYVVCPPDRTVPSGDLTDARRRLRKILLQTGGSVVETESYGQLTQRFTRVFDEFRSRYLLSYEPTGVRQDDG